MNREEFLENLQDLLQRDDPLTPDMELRGLPEWDSLSMMRLAAFFDEHFNMTLAFADFEALITVDDLLKKAGLES
jgi:acyl carrier protein